MSLRMNMNKYSKNFILLGDLNSYCLLCKESSQTVEDLEKHIRWEEHRKNIKQLNPVPVPKFRKDRIFKIDNKYFCEHCNQVCSTVREVAKHIENENHQKRKINPESDPQPAHCKREFGFIVIGKDRHIIKIINKEWFGIIDSKCIFCNVAVGVDEIVKHVSLPDHMITMIQSKLVQNEEGLFYREFKGKYGYCFLCKTTFEVESKSNHWKDERHLEKMKDYNEKNAKTQQEKKLEVTIRLINSQKDYFDIDLENKVAKCKICTGYLNINFQHMIEHKKIHNVTDKDKIEEAPVDMDEVYKSLKCKKSSKEFYDHGKIRAELAKFGRENHIKLMFPGGRGYCKLCCTYISASMKKFTEHIRGHNHMGHLVLQTKPTYETQTHMVFIKDIVHHADVKMITINEQLYLDVYSFMLVTVINDPHRKKFKCFACDVIYDYDENNDHCVSDEHSINFNKAEFVIALEGELIRQIRPNLYHCGVCNRTFAFSNNLEKHIRSWKHVVAKGEREDAVRGNISLQALDSIGENGFFATLLGINKC